MPWQRRNSEFPGIYARKRSAGNRQHPSRWEDPTLDQIRRLPALRTPRLWATRDSLWSSITLSCDFTPHAQTGESVTTRSAMQLEPAGRFATAKGSSWPVAAVDPAARMVRSLQKHRSHRLPRAGGSVGTKGILYLCTREAFSGLDIMRIDVFRERQRGILASPSGSPRNLTFGIAAP
jgi:hypothetical protein